MLRSRSRLELLSEEKQQQQQQKCLQQHIQQQQQQPQLQTRPRKPRDVPAHSAYAEGNLGGPPAEVAPAAPPVKEEHPRGYHTPSKRLRSAFFWMYYRAAAAVRSRQLRTLCATLFTIVLLVWLLRTPARLGKKQGRQLSYAVYIDGGSSGTRVHVFEYRHSLWPAYVQLNLPEKIFSVEPGLSTYAGHPEQAAAALQPLLEFAYQQVPESQWAHTPVHLMTTAGLRLLPPADADAILQACTQLLASSRFTFRPRWARIIDGDDEGLYAWAAANYVSGALEDASQHHHHHSRKDVPETQSQPSHFNGVLELGGASFQITFMPSLPDSTVQHSGFPVPLPGITRPLFTHSYLGLGMDAALRKGTSVVLSQRAARQAEISTGQGGHHLDQQQQQQQQQSQQSQQEQQLQWSGGRQLGHWESTDEQTSKGGAVLDPCLPVGYQEQDGRRGSGSFEGCMQVVQQVLPPRVCSSSRSSSTSTTSSSSGGSSSGGHSLSSHAEAAAHGGRLKDIVGLGGALQGSQHAAHDEGTAGGNDFLDHGLRHWQQQQQEDGHGQAGGDGGGVSRSLQSLLGLSRAATAAAAGVGDGGHEHCTMDGVYVPPVSGTNFLAIENFFWTARALGLGPTATLAEVQEAGQEHCALPWSQLHQNFAGHVPHKFITRYCFGAAYVVALLHDRLGVGQHDRCLHFTNSISRPAQSFDWDEEEDEEEDHHDGSGDGIDSIFSKWGHSNMDESSSSDGTSDTAGAGHLGDKAGGDRILRAATHSVDYGVPAGSVGPPPTVAVGLSWVVGAMVVETMHSRYGDHPGFLFEGGLGEFEQGVQDWMQHHVAMVLLAGGGLAVMLVWRGWRTLSVLSRGSRGTVGMGRGNGGSYIGRQAEVRVL